MSTLALTFSFHSGQGFLEAFSSIPWMISSRPARPRMWAIGLSAPITRVAIPFSGAGGLRSTTSPQPMTNRRQQSVNSPGPRYGPQQMDIDLSNLPHNGTAATSRTALVASSKPTELVSEDTTLLWSSHDSR